MKMNPKIVSWIQQHGHKYGKAQMVRLVKMPERTAIKWIDSQNLKITRNRELSENELKKDQSELQSELHGLMKDIVEAITKSRLFAHGINLAYKNGGYDAALNVKNEYEKKILEPQFLLALKNEWNQFTTWYENQASNDKN